MESGVRLNRIGKNAKNEKESDAGRNGLLNTGLKETTGPDSTFKEFHIKPPPASERSKSGPNPSVDEIISGIIQLIGGNVKLGRPPSKPQIPSHLADPNPDLYGVRINNRGPAGGASQMPSLVPPSVLIGPGPQSGHGQPLPLSPYNKLSKPAPPGFPPGFFDDADISMILGHKLLPQPAKDPYHHPPRRIPGNTILPKYPPVIEGQLFSPFPSSYHHHPDFFIPSSELSQEVTTSIHYNQIRPSQTAIIIPPSRSESYETMREQKLKLPSTALLKRANHFNCFHFDQQASPACLIFFFLLSISQKGLGYSAFNSIDPFKIINQHSDT